jgi:hypothetical protein
MSPCRRFVVARAVDNRVGSDGAMSDRAADLFAPTHLIPRAEKY